mmetsp:Transcript_89716/g.131328  ORF Transcript_89716/g.131328 Transcript_89716/m.131328 type:complete len:288 (+) Transcript_89716:224-1087(+)
MSLQRALKQSRKELDRMKMGTKTEKLVKQLADTHKRLRDSSSRSGMSAQDRVLLERQIARLEGSVADLTAHLCEKGVAYIKKDGMFTMAARQAMSQLVTQKGTTFNSAYQDVVVAWQCMALQMGHTLAGLIAPGCKSAEFHAAVSSVAMSGRLVQFVRCWEMAAVVSGDGREVQGTGLSWCRDERPQEALEGEPGFMFPQSSTEQTSQDDNVTRMDLSSVDAASTRPVTVITMPASTGGVEKLAPAGSDNVMSQVDGRRNGTFMTMAFDGTSTWWGRNFISMAICFI